MICEGSLIQISHQVTQDLGWMQDVCGYSLMTKVRMTRGKGLTLCLLRQLASVQNLSASFLQTLLF